MNELRISRVERHMEIGTWSCLRNMIVCDYDGRIAEVCFHMIADDRRCFCDLQSMIVCDHMGTALSWRIFSAVSGV